MGDNKTMHAIRCVPAVLLALAVCTTCASQIPEEVEAFEDSINSELDQADNSELVQSDPACSTFAKGSFAGGVKNKEDCETACQKAEGLPKFEYKWSKKSAKASEIDSKCDCVTSKNKYQSLCKDPNFVDVNNGGAEQFAPSLVALTVSTTAAIWYTMTGIGHMV